MPVPSEKEIRRPILEAVKGESPQSFSINDFLKIIAEHFGENLHDMSSLEKTTLKSYIKDAKTYLRINKLISNPSKQTYMITKAGADILEHTEGIIDDECLKNFADSHAKLEAAVLPELPPLTDPVPDLPDTVEMTEEPAESEELVAEAPAVEEPAIDAQADSETPQEVEDIAEPVEEQAAGIDVEESATEEPVNDSEPQEIPAPEPEPEHEQIQTPEPEIISTPESEPEQIQEADPEPEAVPETENVSEPETVPEPEDMPESEPEQEPEQETLPEPQEELDEQEYTDDTNGDEDMTEILPEEEIMPAEDNDDTEDFADESQITEHAGNIEEVLARHNAELAEKVLTRTAELSSDTFEVLVTDLLSKMGYRVFANARYTNGASDNGMIQGVILDSQETVPIYIHAQKLSPGRVVGRADVQDFVEALADKGGKGIFA